MKLLFSKPITISLLFVAIVLLAMLVITHSTIYTEPFNKDFMYGKYYQSQWVVPQSEHPISDEDLYQVAGYELVTTGTHYKINPEVPPLGKYLFGWSILLFHNPYVISLLLFLMSVLVFYGLSTFLIKIPSLRLLSLILFVADPLLSSLAYKSLLDLPLLLAMLIHILMLFLVVRQSKPTFPMNILFILGLGITCGAFAAIKFPFLAIVIICADIILLIRLKKPGMIVPVLIVASITYLGTYTTYLLAGHTIIDLLKAQKWMLVFYLSSKAQAVYGTVFTSLITGAIKGWHEGAQWDRVAEWNLRWPVLFFTTIIGGVHRFKDILNNYYLLYLALVSCGLIAIYIVVPFFARYLSLVIPLFILFSVYFVESIVKKK